MSVSSRQRAAFSAYLALGPMRSLAKLHAELMRDPVRHGLTKAPSLRTLESWSTTNRWSDEVESLERQAAQEEQRAHIDQIKEYRARLRKEGLLLQQKGISWLSAKEADDVRSHEAIRAIAEGFRLEALGLGDITESVEVKEDHDGLARGLSDEELDRLITALRGAASGTTH
jgi:hypothetical protein